MHVILQNLVLHCYSCSMLTGSEKDKSKEDDLKKTLMSYKKNHRNIYVYLSESEKLIRSLRSYLVSGQLASSEAFWRADGLAGLYAKIRDPPSRNLVVSFFVDVNLPAFLTEIVRILRGNLYPEAFSQGEKRVVSAGKDLQPKRKKKASSVKAGSGDETPAEVRGALNEFSTFVE